jgi:hypothetical protein
MQKKKMSFKTSNECFPFSSSDGSMALWPLPLKTGAKKDDKNLFAANVASNPPLKKVQQLCQPTGKEKVTVVNKNKLFNCTIDPKGPLASSLEPGKKQAVTAMQCNVKKNDPASKKTGFLCARAQDASNNCKTPGKCADKSAVICVKQAVPLKTTNACGPVKLDNTLTWPLKSVEGSSSNSNDRNLYPGSRTQTGVAQVTALCQTDQSFLASKSKLTNCETMDAKTGKYKCLSPKIDSGGKKLLFTCAQPYKATGCTSGEVCVNKTPSASICVLGNVKEAVAASKNQVLLDTTKNTPVSTDAEKAAAESSQNYVNNLNQSTQNVAAAQAVSKEKLAAAVAAAERRAALEYGQDSATYTAKKAAWKTAPSITPATHGIFNPTQCKVQGVTFMPNYMDKTADPAGMQFFQTPETVGTNICFFPKNQTTQRLCYNEDATFGCNINFDTWNSRSNTEPKPSLASAQDVDAFVSNKLAADPISTISDAPKDYSAGFQPHVINEYSGISAIRRCMTMAMKFGGDKCDTDKDFYGTWMQQCMASIADDQGNACDAEDARVKTTSPLMPGDSITCQPRKWMGKDFQSQYFTHVLRWHALPDSMNTPPNPAVPPSLELTRANIKRGNNALQNDPNTARNCGTPPVRAMRVAINKIDDLNWKLSSGQQYPETSALFHDTYIRAKNDVGGTDAEYKRIRDLDYNSGGNNFDALNTAALETKISNVEAWTPAVEQQAQVQQAAASASTVNLTEGNVCTQKGIKLYGYVQNPVEPTKCSYVPKERNLMNTIDSDRVAVKCRKDLDFTSYGSATEIKNWARVGCNVRTQLDCVRKEISIYGFHSTPDPNLCVPDYLQEKDYDRLSLTCKFTNPSFGTGYNTVEEVIDWAHKCAARTSIDCNQPVAPNTYPGDVDGVSIGGYRGKYGEGYGTAMCTKLNVPYNTGSTGPADVTFTQTSTLDDYVNWARNNKNTIRDNNFKNVTNAAGKTSQQLFDVPRPTDRITSSDPDFNNIIQAPCLYPKVKEGTIFGNPGGSNNYICKNTEWKTCFKNPTDGTFNCSINI